MAQMGDDVTGRSLEWRYDGDNRVWVYAYFTAGGTDKTPGQVEYFEEGFRYKALASNTETYFMGVPDGTIASATWAWVQIGGPCDDVITASLSVSVGHALGVNAGAITDIGADYSGGATEWAVNRAVTSSATAHDVIMTPRLITATST